MTEFFELAVRWEVFVLAFDRRCIIKRYGKGGKR